jgi:hypothetical protein
MARRETRKCSACGKKLPTTEFYSDPRVKSGLRRRCRKCHSRKNYESRKTSDARHAQPEYERVARFRKFGLTEDEWQAMRKRQKDRCKICGQRETLKSKGQVKNLCIDHCHDTGKVRGLLCNRCNTSIGWFNDDPKLLRSAVAYLEEHS